MTYLCFKRMPRPIRPELWQFLRQLADRVVTRWSAPDRGIWEVRDEPRHFVHSKLLCWVALDRAIRLAEQAKLTGDLRSWRQARSAIREAILSRGYNPEIRAFTQAFDRPELDASALVIPLVEFLPASDPRVCATIERIQERLVSQGLVYRYLSHDGLPEGEGAFALCSFWLVNNLALLGRIDEARALFENVCGRASDLGLLSEQIDPASGVLLGNYPQSFTHLGLIRAALHIAAAEAGRSARKK